MEIKRNFVNLYSFKYQNEKLDELNRLLSDWVNPEYLEDFFVLHEMDLSFSGLNIDNAIERTLTEANKLASIFLSLNSTVDSIQNLDSYFRTLDDNEMKAVVLSKQKSKKFWLRLYAIRIEKNCYVFTGGAIKLTKTMQEREHTQKELIKLDKCREFLRLNGVIDIESFNEFNNQDDE
jgi:hypothetical protein